MLNYRKKEKVKTAIIVSLLAVIAGGVTSDIIYKASLKNSDDWPSTQKAWNEANRYINANYPNPKVLNCISSPSLVGNLLVYDATYKSNYLTDDGFYFNSSAFVFYKKDRFTFKWKFDKIIYGMYGKEKSYV